MKRATLLLFTLLIISYSTVISQSPGNCYADWYNLYALHYSQLEETDRLNTASPSLVHTFLTNKALENKAAQIVFMSSLVEPDEVPDIDLYIDQRNFIRHDVTASPGEISVEGTITELSTVGLFIPTTKLFKEDGTIDIQFSRSGMLNILASIDQTTGEVRSSRNSLDDSRSNDLVSIAIFNKNGRIVHFSGFDEKVTLNYRDDLYNQVLTFQLVYSSGLELRYKFVINPHLYDVSLNGPFPETSLNDPDNDPDPILKSALDAFELCFGPVDIFPQQECLIQGEVEIITAEIGHFPYPTISNDTPVILVPGDENNNTEAVLSLGKDYYMYSTNANDAVHNGDNGEYANYGQIKAHYYINPSRTRVTRPIILTDGIDFFSDRTADQILSSFGGNSTLQLLFDGGYDLIIADFVGGADFIQKNAFALVELIDQLNNEDEVEEIAAIIGPSMGGQVARYALLHWESLLIPTKGPHNVTHFVSADSPWLGANASPAIQAAARLMKDVNIPIGEFAKIGEAMLKIDKMANAPAARQLLLHQVHGLDWLESNSCTYELNPLDEVFYSEYEYNGVQHPFKNSFDNGLANLGDFPTQTNLIAIADGGNGGASNFVPAPDLASPGTPILKYSEGLSTLSDPGIEINSIQNQSKLIDLDLGWELDCFARRQFNIKFDDIEVASSAVPNLDVIPGSPFNLEGVLQFFGLANSSIYQGTFTFIPTFSALAIPNQNPTANLSPTNTSSPVFGTNYFVDNVSSEHNSFTGQAGSLPFFLNQIGYESGSLDPCEYASYYLNESSNGNPEITISVVNTEQGTGQYNYVISDAISNFCSLDFSIINTSIADGGEIEIAPVEYEERYTVINSCGLDWDYQNNVPVFPDNTPVDYTCPMTLSYCVSLNDCEVCEMITVNFVPGEQGGIDPSGHFSFNDLSANISQETNTQSNQASMFNIKPNPSSGQITVSFDEGTNIVNVFRIDGSLMMERIVSAGINDINLNFDKGVYILRVYNSKTNRIEIEKIVIQ